MKQIGLFFIVLICIIFSSCHQSKKGKNEINNQKWVGKEIIVPATLSFKALGKDTLCSNLWDKPYKIFTYIDSTGCSICQMDLPEWNAKIQLCHQLQIDVGFIFAIHSSNFNQFEDNIVMSYFDYPIIYDYFNEFENSNHFSLTSCRTFLLDKDNKILLSGSPINDNNMWELYKKIITKSEK